MTKFSDPVKISSDLGETNRITPLMISTRADQY